MHLKLSQTKIVTTVFALSAVMLLPVSATACPAKPPSPGFIEFMEREIPTGPVPSGSSNIEIQIDGFAALGSQAGDSCGAAPALPDGLRIVSIEFVHSQTGKPVGFEGFRPDPNATTGFCAGRRKGCTGFVSRVGKAGLKEGTPMKVVIQAVQFGKTSGRRMNALAAKMLKSFSMAAGGAAKDGSPHHHLAVFRPTGVQVELGKH